MSGTVLGKSCLVLGVEFGMWNAKAAPGAGAGTGLEPGGRGHCPRNGHTATGIQLPGGIKPGEARPQQEPSSLQLPGS